MPSELIGSAPPPPEPAEEELFEDVRDYYTPMTKAPASGMSVLGSGSALSVMVNATDGPEPEVREFIDQLCAIFISR